MRDPGTHTRRPTDVTACLCSVVLLWTSLVATACGSEPAPPDDAQCAPAPANPDAPDYVLFEEDPVRPIAASPDGTLLFVANMPSDQLDIVRVADDGALTLEQSVPVGLRPVTVAVRDASEVWVVNHLSDSVSIVDVASRPARVVRTLLVGDEPRDLVFANGRAFIATAHRGQHRTDASLVGVPGAGDPQLTTPGIGRGDVWVFDAEAPAPDGALGGRPLAIVSTFSDKLRALAVSPDGATVYAAAFHSGNRTSVVGADNMCLPEGDDPVFTPCTTYDGSSAPGSHLPPFDSADGTPAAHVGLIVQQGDDARWRDAIGRDWSELVRFDLPDQDVFAIDSTSLAVRTTFSGVGTTLFGMAVDPRSGRLFVSHTDSRNTVRFEGPGEHGGSTVQGDLARAGITVVDPTSGEVAPRALNTHIDRATLPAPVGTAEHSLATPLQVTLSEDGETLYVAAYGSATIGVVDVADLSAGTFDPRAASDRHIRLSGGGPAGFVLDEARDRVVVYTRFDNALTTLDLADHSEQGRLALTSPEPTSIIAGRAMLYDARQTSSNGESSCASCHVFGDADHLAWDLGNPDALATRNDYNSPHLETVFVAVKAAGSVPLVEHLAAVQNGDGDLRTLHPMKGPMLTQTLRGMAHHGPMHWRGDRMVGFFGADTATKPPFDARLSFMNFIVAFDGLLGRPATVPTSRGLAAVSEEKMGSFADFALALMLPPSPVRALDRGLSEAQRRGLETFMGCVGPDSITGAPVVCTEDGNGIPRPAPGTGHRIDGVGGPDFSGEGWGETCEGCHRLDPEAGFFGTDGRMAFDALPQTAKVPQLRGLYDRVGMFGVPGSEHFMSGSGTPHLGPQIRGFGYSHDGVVPTVFTFFTATHFQPGGFLGFGPVGFTGGDAQRRDVEAFILAFDSDLAPITGQQVTLRPDSAPATLERLALLEARARTRFTSAALGGAVHECDLVVSGIADDRPMRALYLPDQDRWRTSRGELLTSPELRRLVTTAPLTFTCTTPGSGRRWALDRDRDGRCDDER